MTNVSTDAATLVALAASVERAPEYARSAQTGSARLDALVDWWIGLNPASVLNYRALAHPDCARVEAAINSSVTLMSFPTEISDNDAALRSVIGLYSGSEISDLLPRDRSDHEWITDAQQLRDDLFRLRDLRADPAAVVHILDIPELTQRVEALLTCASRHTPCILESLPDYAAALIADRLTHRGKGWWLACSTSQDEAVTAAMHRLALEPTLDLQLTSYSKIGATVIAELLDVLTSTD